MDNKFDIDMTVCKSVYVAEFYRPHENDNHSLYIYIL